MMSRSARVRVGVAGALLPLILTAACGGSTKSASVGSGGGDVVLGTSLSMTGPLGQFGVNEKAGYQQKIDEINKAGGLLLGGAKHHVNLIVLDNRSDPNTASQQIRELALKDNATALLGACTPPIVVPEAQAADRAKVPYVSTCNPVRAFQGGNSSGWHYSWDLFFDEQDQASTVAKGLAMAGGNKKVALFTDTEPDGVAERPLYKQAMAAAGLDVVGDYTFPVGTSDFSSFINDAKSKGVQLIAGQMVPPDGIALWKQMSSLGLKLTAAFVAKAATTKAWPQALGPVAEGTLSEAFWSPATGKANSQELAQKLGQQFPNDLPDLNIAVIGYTVAAVVTDAISAAGSTDHDKVNTAIGRTNADYPAGHIAFAAGTHTVVTPYLLTQWQNANMVPIVPPQPGVTLEVPAKGLQ